MTLATFWKRQLISAMEEEEMEKKIIVLAGREGRIWDQAIKEGQESRQPEIDRLTRDRDALLAACKIAAKMLDCDEGYERTLEMLQEAIYYTEASEEKHVG